MTTHENIGVAEHGARAGTLYARCACGWSGPGRRSMEATGSDLIKHFAEVKPITMDVDCHAYAWHLEDEDFPECGPTNLTRMKETYGVEVEHLPNGPYPDGAFADWAWWYRLTGEPKAIIQLLAAEYTGGVDEAKEMVDGATS